VVDEIAATAVPLGLLAVTYVLFRAKHLLADYFLQTCWMARGKGSTTGWAVPLLAHAGVHGLGTAAITLLLAPALWWLGVVDLVVHGAIDRLKAMPSLGGRWQPCERAFWWALGLDQEAHSLTHFVFVVLIVLAASAAA
jgi:hypothetical protein